MSLFGSTAAQPQTSLFGNTAGAQPAQPAQGSSLFGGSTLGQTNQQQPAQGTSSFGNLAPQQQQQFQQQAGTSLFGGFGQPQTQQANQAQPGTTSFFGQPTAQQQTSAPAGAGTLFGGFQPAGNLFSSNTVNTGSTGNLFGQTTAGSGGLFGAQSNIQRQSTQPANFTTTTQPTSAPIFTKSTKFNDLPEEVKRTLESIDSFIQGRVQISNELRQRKVGEEATKSQELIRSAHKDLVNIVTDLQADVHHTRNLKTKTDQTVQDTIVATRIIDGFRNPQQHGMYLKNHASFPLEFFQRVTDEMRERLRWYKSTIEQIERKLASAAVHNQATPHAIVSTLEAQHATFMALASRTAAVDTELQKIRALYTQLWRAKTGSMRDPFNDLDRVTGDFGLESLSGK